MSINTIQKIHADSVFGALNNAAHDSRVLSEFLDKMLADGEASFQQGEYVAKKLAELSRKIYESAIDANDIYNELIAGTNNFQTMGEEHA
jgi:hypothetical protein